MEQFAAVRWVFPSSPLGVTVGSHQDPGNMSLTGGLHRKTYKEQDDVSGQQVP